MLSLSDLHSFRSNKKKLQNKMEQQFKMHLRGSEVRSGNVMLAFGLTESLSDP